MPQDPLSLLCIEPTFPGRLGAVADWLVRKRGYRCLFYCASAEAPSSWPAATGHGLDVLRYDVGGVARESAVAWTRGLERGLCYAFGCYEVLTARRPRPVDLVLGRSKLLGSTLFAPVALPGAPVVNLFDYYLAPHANDVAEEADPPLPAEYFHWRRSAHAMDLLDLENGVAPWTHSAWQRDLFPDEYRGDFTVLHDGIDAGHFPRRAPGPRAVAGRPIPREALVVSFVASSLDRVRGFDRFVRLANRLLQSDLDLLFLVVGGAPVNRSLDVAFHGRDYQAAVLRQTPLARPERFWFLGAVAPATVAEVLAASDLHVYPSRPYPVARSLLEALAAGCVVLAWDTAPVREVLTDRHTGLLVSPPDEGSWVRAARQALEDRAGHRPLGEAAATLVRERYDRDVTLPHLASWFDRLAAKGR